MDDTDRDLARCDEITRSSLLLVVGIVLQMVLLILAFLVILAVPAMLNDVAESAQSVIGVATWMNWLAYFVAGLLSMYIIDVGFGRQRYLQRRVRYIVLN